MSAKNQGMQEIKVQYSNPHGGMTVDTYEGERLRIVSDGPTVSVREGGLRDEVVLAIYSFPVVAVHVTAIQERADD